MPQQNSLNSWQRLLGLFEGDSRSLKRLSDALPVVGTRLESLILRHGQNPPWGLLGEKCLQNARSAHARHAADEGWSCLLEAERMAVEGLRRCELDALLISLRKETLEKLKDWRQLATKELLALETNKAADTDEKLRLRLQEALRIRNEHFHNQYVRINIQKSQLLIAGLIVAAALLTTLVVASSGAPSLGDEMIRLAALVGLLGGALSTAVSLARSTNHKIPEHLASWSTTLIRPVIGSAAAVAAVLFLKAGQVTLGNNDDWAVLAVSFLAGFSEQWFLRVIGNSSEKAK
jgi:hypothetical protein